ncbi:hypothetical protein MTR67_038496 [Solanum verrucosum]|uniref:DUF4283 domain-containing protein n=1 Tax=Solanum verrucosum TaxID=315347 RepID=A0AAF0UGD9_SOLVR|nr:hypothetical protein MTR67_038496 [Solanum verrucosum]
MAATATGQPPPEVGQITSTPGCSYAEKLKPKATHVQSIPLKPVTYLHGEPQVIWEQDEVNQMIVNENLEYAVIGKFSYGWPDIQNLRKLIPKQCELKGDCNIRLLSNRHVLIRATLLEDYVHLLSKSAFYITQNNWSYPVRTLKWDPMFKPEKETTTAITWISFPSLPPIFFCKEAVFSVAAAVGKPLQVDMTTKNQIRPSCERVKVEVDLLKEFLKRIKIGMRMQNNDVAEKWIKIKYDYVPKYCQMCMIQGHDEEQCYVVHPELHPYKEKSGNDRGKQIEERPSKGDEKGTELMGREEDNLHMRKGEDFVEPKRKFWGGGRNKEPQKVWNKVGIITGNKFNLLDTGNQEQSLNQEEEQTNGKEIKMEQRQSKEISQGLQGSSHNKHIHTIRISSNSKDMTGKKRKQAVNIQLVKPEAE